jgi:phage shock protein PspC (stress-responsive transcriptional regulator)
MNKTIIININGIIFHIEEDAYDILKNYITGIKKHFAGTDDSLEITTDIENRIAEMFAELLKKDGKQVIVIADVTAVILQMGTIEDFSVEENEPAFTSGTTAHATERRLFRDADDHLIGGVAAGISNYFDIQPVWVRLAFVVTTFLGGGGLLVYIILWLIIPRANTRAEKMAMKGEKVDLQGFKRSFEEELKNVRQSLSNANREAKPILYKFRDFIGEFFLLLKRFFNGGGKVLLRLIAIAICVICAFIIIGLAIAITVFSANQSMFVHGFSPFNIVNYEFSNVLYVCGFLVCAVPLFGLILFTIRIVFSKYLLGRSIGFILLIGWIAAASTVAYYTTKIAGDFREEASFSQSIDLQKPLNQHYFLKINTSKLLTKEDSATLGIKKNDFANRIIVNMNDESNTDLSPENVRLYIDKSEGAFPIMVKSFHAKGPDYRNALLNARNTSYNFLQQDSVILFDRKLYPVKRALWRDQKIDLNLKIPVNSTITIDQSLNFILRDVDFYECANDDDGNWKHRLATFKMTETGLVCLKDTTKKQAEVKH